jgi:hypothetical protein
MAFHPAFNQLGSLQLVETYEFYDKPLLFVCQNTTGHLFLAVLVDENDVGETWIYAPISTKRLEQVRAGIVDLHDAFAQAENGHVYEVIVPHNSSDDVQVAFLPVDRLTDDILPLQGERLSLNTQTLPTVAPSTELRSRAVQSRREHITLRLTLPDQKLTEAPAELLGEVLLRFQELLKAVSTSLSEAVGARRTGHTLPQVNVQGFAHSSFAVELVSDTSVDLFGESEVGRTLEQVLDLFEIDNDPDRLKQKITELKLRVAVGYAMFLKALGTNVSNTTIDWASPKHDNIRSTTMTLRQVRETIETIEKTELQPPESVVISGTLIGANLRSKTFEISAIERQKRRKYSGRIDDNSLRSVRGSALGQDYRTTLIQTVVINYATGQVDPKYTLVSLENL